MASLKDGFIPWHREWLVEAGGAHRSFSTKKPYRGVNPFTLDIAAWRNGYKSPFWITMNQIKKNGGNLKKINKPDEKGTGQKAHMVVFWKLLFVDDEKNPGEKKVIPLLRHFNVFNLDQTEGIEAPKLNPDDLTPVERAEGIVNGYEDRPEIKVSNDEKPVYDGGEDVIRIRDDYPDDETYFSALFPSLIRSTGHGDRLNRMHFEDGTIKEALIGELGSAMLHGLAGLKIKSQVKDQDAYIDSWVEAFEDDSRLIVGAASKAQKAADYIMGDLPEDDDDE